MLIYNQEEIEFQDQMGLSSKLKQNQFEGLHKVVSFKLN